MRREQAADENTGADVEDEVVTTESPEDESGEELHNADDAFADDLTDAIAEALAGDEDEDEDDAGDEDDDEGEEESDDDEDSDDEEDEGDEGEEREQQPRDAQGKFTTAEESAATAPRGEAAKTGDAAPADAAKGGKPAEQQAQWEPLSVTADKETVPIAEAKITRSGGHVFIGMPEKDYARFQQRLSRGAIYERDRAQIDREKRELDARRNAPPKKSEAEIEAEIINEALKPYLKDLMDEKDLQVLELRIKNAKHEYAKTWDKEEGERMTKAAEPSWDEQQATAIQNLMGAFVNDVPELKGLTSEDLEDLFLNEFLPVRNSLVFREGDEAYANTEYIVRRMKARAAAGIAGKPKTETTDSSAPSKTPDKSGHSSTTASHATSDGKTKTGAAERFNRGVDAAKPRTTNLKAGRGNARPSDKRTTRDPNAKRKVASPAEEQENAEDAWRRTERAFLSSDDLDFDVDEDSED